jgi:hypothetical protein
MIHKQSVWLALAVLLAGVLALAWLANNYPPCIGGGRYSLSQGRCVHYRPHY